MVTMEFFTSALVGPFIVLTAKHKGHLSKQWENYQGRAKVTFQPNHWMDALVAKKYLNWLKNLYPRKIIGLLWDHAGPHISTEVVEYAQRLGIVVDFINKGMTSVQQPCDLYANQRIKKVVKELYHEYRLTLAFDEQTNVKVPRELFLSWVETAVDTVHQGQRLNMEIRRVFQKCGLDPYDTERLLFEKHLETLSTEALYKALTEGQTATMLL